MTKLNTFEDYVYESTNLILDQLIANKISIVNAAGIFYFIEKSKDLENLKKILEILKQEYPVLEEIFEIEKSEIKISTEELVTKFISYIIKDNPLLAAEISSEACKKDTKLEDLKSKYPLFAEYLARN